MCCVIVSPPTPPPPTPSLSLCLSFSPSPPSLSYALSLTMCIHVNLSHTLSLTPFLSLVPSPTFYLSFPPSLYQPLPRGGTSLNLRLKNLLVSTAQTLLRGRLSLSKLLLLLPRPALREIEKAPSNPSSPLSSQASCQDQRRKPEEKRNLPQFLVSG